MLNKIENAIINKLALICKHWFNKGFLVGDKKAVCVLTPELLGIDNVNSEDLFGSGNSEVGI